MAAKDEVQPSVTVEIDNEDLPAVAFNDKYDPSDHPLSLDQLSEDLSMLGQSIAARIEVEDQLIAALMERAAA